MPPTKLREWTAEDRTLASALLAHEKSIGRCGHSHHVTLKPGADLDGWFKVNDSQTCPACAALDEWKQDADPEKLPAGVLPRVVNLKDEPDEE